MRIRSVRKRFHSREISRNFLNWLAPHPDLLHGVMIFASGGILYAVFQDIAPQAKLERRGTPPMGAVLGFLTGLLGNLWIEAAS